MPKLTAGIIARDAATDIRACLESLAWADERLVILDPRTRDDTAAIARELGARVVEHTFEDFGRQREFGLTLLPAGEWLFYLDTDERATVELAEEIRGVIASDKAVGWWVPRRNVIWGGEMRHGGWFPDYQLRLLQVGHAHYDLTREVHEVVNLDGAEAFLRQPLWHYNYRTLGQFIAKQRQYTDYEAAILFKQGVRPKPWTYLLQPLREFRRRYLTLQGYRDGLGGLALCAWVAYYYGFVVTVKNGRLWRAAAQR